MSAPGPDRAWSTWDPRFPACMMHLPSRFAVRVALFSATENRYDPFAAEDQLAFALGEHTLDGDYVALSVRSAGTTLGIEFARGEASGVSARVRILEPGEMMFRLGIMVEAGFLAPATPDPRTPEPPMDGELALVTPGGRAWLQPAEARARRCGRCFHLAVSPRPAISGHYARPSRVADDLEHRGWLYHPPPAPDGDWVALRLTGDPRQAIMIAVALDEDGDPGAAAAAAHARLARVTETVADASERARAQGSPPARAVRDVMAWNTVWDANNQRVYTAASRGWLRGFGGWGIWLSDAFYSTLLCARVGDAGLARANLEAVLAGATAAGNLPCLAAADETWVDRTQLPVAAFTVWRAYLLSGERALLTAAYPVLARQLDWVTRERDGNANGLYEYGSSAVGDAQWAGTRQGALNESGMDNLAVFDEAVFRPQAGTIDLEEPGHNALLSLEWQALSWIAAELGHVSEADDLGARGRALAARIRIQLWDAARGIFAARRWDGTVAAHVSPTSFFPLVAGAATEAQTEAMLDGWLRDPARFGGTLPLPSAPLEDPVSREDSYWRGRIWAPMLYWTWEGLHRVGRRQDARELARRAWEMFEPEWSAKRHCHENYHARDPARHDAHDSDPFYSWGALIPFMWEAERADASPWEGLVVSPGACVSWRGATVSAHGAGATMRLRVDGAELPTELPARRLAHVSVADGGGVRYDTESNG